MGSEQGRGLKVGEHGGAALWGRKASATLVHSGELLRRFDDCVVGNVRHCWVEWSWGSGLRRSPAPRVAHSCSRGNDPELSSLQRSVLGRAGGKKRR